LPSPLLFSDSTVLSGFTSGDPSGLSSQPQSRTGSPALGLGEISRPSSKRIRLLSNSRSLTPEVSGGTSSWAGHQWTPALQERFETHIANITASCGFAFNWVENQAVRSFVNEFFPFANPISSYQLANRIIPREVGKFHQAAKNRCRGNDATLQADGWTGVVRTRISGTVRSKRNASATLRKGNADATDGERTGLGFSSCAAPLIRNAPLFQRAEDGVDSEERSSAEGRNRLHFK